jgi:hypothetical protein
MILNIIKKNSTIIDYSIYGTEAYQYYDQTSTSASYFYRSGMLLDANLDGKYEYIFSISRYANKPIPLIMVGDEIGEINLTKKYFPEGSPLVSHSSIIYYIDINNDGRKDIISSDAGLDYPPWTGRKIGVAIWKDGIFKDVSNLLPDISTRNYAIGIGNFNNDNVIDILLPAQGSNNPTDSSLATFINGNFEISPNPIKNYIGNLNNHTSIQCADFNLDGIDDFLFSGSWADRNNKIIYGDKTGLNANILNILPPGPLGEELADFNQKNPGITLTRPISGPEVFSIVADFNGDGKPDIFSLSEKTTSFPPGTFTDKTHYNYDYLYKSGGMVYGPLTFSTLINIDGFKFSPHQDSRSNLGDVYYPVAFPFDINGDGNLDVIGHYWTLNSFDPIYGTTFFINDGNGNFNPLDAKNIFPELIAYPYKDKNHISEFGLIVPITNTATNFSGLQILPAPYNTGIFKVQNFSSDSLYNISDYYKNSDSINIQDRKLIKYINTANGNDFIIDKNNYYSTQNYKSTLQISLELISKKITDPPNISIKVNDNLLLSPTIINGSNSSLQLIDIDLSLINELSSLELIFNGLKFIDETKLSYAIIRKLSFLGNEISFAGATFINGFAFDSSVAQMNGNGTIKFTNTSLKSANSDISKISYSSVDIVDGGKGRDTSAYTGLATDYSIKHNENGSWSVYKKGSVNDLLTNIERLQFKDKSVAIDITGNAGTTAKILGAVFGKESLNNKNYIGIGLHFLDAGWTYDNLAGLALDAAGAKSNDQIVSLLWTNVIGTKPTAADKQPFIALLENGMTAGALAHLAADSSFNITNINLVGLAQTGIEYLPVG